jgi:hypothetical protein
MTDAPPPPEPLLNTSLPGWNAAWDEADNRRKGVTIGPVQLRGEVTLGQLIQAFVVLGSAVSGIFAAGAWVARLEDRLAQAEARTVDADHAIAGKLDQLKDVAQDAAAQAAQRATRAKP